MKTFLYCLVATIAVSLAYSLSNTQYNAAFREFLQNSSALPAFFAGDYFTGLEYGYIGYHLAEGHGFAGPFHEVTAPTGTMPPVLPLIYASVYKVFGFKTVASFWALFLIRSLAVAGGFALLIRLANQLKHSAITASPRVVLLVAIVFVAVFAFGNLFFFYYDEWFMWFLVALSLYWAYHLLSRDSVSIRQATIFGFFIGLIVLAQTVLGAALMASVSLVGMRTKRYALLIVVPVAMIVSSIWITRNYFVFHEFMPVKSNLGFELYFSTVHESRGILILEEQKSSRRHPIKEGPEKQFALGLGEQEYQRRKTQEFLQILQTDPMRYFTKVGFRALYATVLFPYSNEEAKVQAPAPAIIKYLFYPLVFVFWLVQWFMPGRRHPFTLFLLILFAAYLTPYILINFWLKYWIHLLPATAVMVALSTSEFFERYVREKEI